MTERLQNEEARQFMQLLGGKWVSAAVSAAAKLGVADVLAEQSVSVGRLAELLDCDEPSLDRLVGVLCGEGLIERGISGELTLTDFGRHLTSDSLGPVAVYIGESFAWNPWSRLSDAIRDGSSAFEEEHGSALFEYLEQHPDAAATYHQGVDAYTRAQALALLNVFDFHDRKSVIDIGGGRGTLLFELLTHETHLAGTLLDLESALRSAESRFDAATLQSRVTIRQQSFFDPLPSEHDVYVLKHVLHNWSDVDARKILARCREAMGIGAVLLIVEGFVLPGNRRDAVKMLDLEMMVLFGGGRERSKPAFRRLLHECGFRMEVTVDLAGTTRLLVCHPR